MIDDPSVASKEAVEAVLADMARAGDGDRGVIVDSPPGAGKTTLVVRAARALAESGEPAMIIAQTNHQIDDLLERLAAELPEIRLGRLSAETYTPPGPVEALPNVAIDTRTDGLADCPLLLGTAAKWARVRDHHRRWTIVDEAYQMRSDALLLVAHLFDRGLFVGDPGQLDPFTVVETTRWTGLSYDPRLNAIDVLLAHNASLPTHRLPVSWRLPASAAPLVSQAFYPFTGFQAGTTEGTRRLEFTTSGLRSPLDETLEMARTAGWALHELPARHTLRTDPQAAEAAANLAARLLARGTVAYCERHPDGRAIGPRDIAIGVAHRDQADQIRRALAAAGAPEVTVDTANRLQGREFEVVIVVHPLSGRRDATAFHLEAGRLCVLTSRHRQACIVVARAGITDLLDAHPSTDPLHLNVPVKFPDGWEAHQTVLSHLAPHRVPAAV
ncbi:AAA domain-containing protein [Thermomonospora amylolytica]|uniref:AAA domain-containing protein n=1 Tax=Thermomonospora amylolytica TaxID=1411117 RepID=UPI001F430913|nr:AAA domain-containing protein [Thermomonospora amylolytica]